MAIIDILKLDYDFSFNYNSKSVYWYNYDDMSLMQQMMKEIVSTKWRVIQIVLWFWFYQNDQIYFSWISSFNSYIAGSEFIYTNLTKMTIRSLQFKMIMKCILFATLCSIGGLIYCEVVFV